LPATLFEQLAPGGLMTVPIIKDGTQYLCLIEKVEGNKAKQTLMMEVDFKRLVKSEDDKANDLPAEDASDPKQPKTAH
jgi:protein-L-isoaspartate O-methyltransferase